jgi:hypothetical protein
MAPTTCADSRLAQRKTLPKEEETQTRTKTAFNKRKTMN